MRERETEHHRTQKKAQTFDLLTFGLSAPMFTKRTRLVVNIIIFGKFLSLFFFLFLFSISTITILSLDILSVFLLLFPH